MSQNTRKGFWGTGALERISERIYKLLPGLRGYSAKNLKKMGQFYEAWRIFDYDPVTCNEQNTQSNNSVIAITELNDSDDQIDIFRELRIPNLGEFPVEDFFKVPFSHHIQIFSGVKDAPARYYYIRKCAEEKLTVNALRKCIKEDDYNRRTELPNNFGSTMADGKSARKAIMAFKDSYVLDFINTEEIGERDLQDYDKPMGVATYTTSKKMPEVLKDALPDMDELKKLL